METKLRVHVTEDCNCCGLCGVKYPDYFFDDIEGKASVRNGFLVLDVEKANDVQGICPVHAITAVKEKKSVRQILADMVDNLKAYKLEYPTKEEIPFKKEEYSIPLPAASGEHRYDYSSDSSANSAARSEFDRKMYSQIDVIILRIITEYRVKYIKPYYSKDETSIYALCNKKLEETLKEICQVLKSEGLADDMPQDFLSVDIFPDENDTTWKMLNKGEMISDEIVSSIRSEFNSGTYSSLSDYESYWDTDDMEVSAGTGFGGRTKYKDKYCYRNLREAFQELAKDILNACYNKDDYIVERARENVKWLIDKYNEKLEKLINVRTTYIEKKIAGMKDMGSQETGLPSFPKMMRRVANDKAGKICVNGCPTEEKEVFIVDTKDGKEQFFFDGKVIKKRRIVDGLIKNEIILKDRQFKYYTIIGYDGQILFDADDCLWRYNCQNNACEKVIENIFSLKIYKNILFYSVQDNLKRINSGVGRPGEERMNSWGSLWCSSYDGGEKHQLKSFGYGSGLILIKSINDVKISYSVVGNRNQEGSVEWRNCWKKDPLTMDSTAEVPYTDYDITEELKTEQEKHEKEEANNEATWFSGIEFGDLNKYWEKIVEEVDKNNHGEDKNKLLNLLAAQSILCVSPTQIHQDKEVEAKEDLISRHLYTEGKLDFSTAYKYVTYLLGHNISAVDTFRNLYLRLTIHERNRFYDLVEDIFKYSAR